MHEINRPVRLILDGDALVHNWKTLARASGAAATGAAVKADGYGLGASDVVKRLSAAGCSDFFVAQWAEAVAIADLVPPDQIAVLNGLGEDDVNLAKSLGAIPVLNTPIQLERWRNAGGGRCHVMLDSGINRLGIGPEQLSEGMFDGLDIDLAMSHLASADEDVPQNREQLALYCEMVSIVPAKRHSLANSAGIQLGPDYHFDLTRPGISLYGGVARDELAAEIRQVVRIEAQVLQVREVAAGQGIGYNATYVAPSPMRVATIAIGYADGYLRGFSGVGSAVFGGTELPVIGRVSMDLVTLDVSGVEGLLEGNWVEINFDLSRASFVSGLSPYELITGLSDRFDRFWT